MTSAAKRSLLLVHGRDFKPQRDTWLELSLAALQKGIERDYPDDVSMFDSLDVHDAWYGDLSNELLLGLGKEYDEQLDVGDRRNALLALSEIAVRKKFSIRQYDCLPGKSAVPEFVVALAAPVLGAFGMTMPLVGCISRDFAAYLRGDSDYGQKIRARVREKLCEMLNSDSEVMLMTHGTGSAIAYDVLWQLSHDREFKQEFDGKKVAMWVTLGSPLGDANIRKRLRGAKEKQAARFPHNVITWHNVSAEDDYTCHDNTLADDFKKMLSHRVVSAVHDHQIYNLAVRYGRSNPHSSLGYYIHPRVSKIVRDWLCFEPPA
jgi:hypothetical protein